jgi:hypothetical protein
MKIKALALALLFATTAAAAAEVDGKWVTSIDSPNGPVQIHYVLKAEGAKLTGTSQGPGGKPVPLKNGKIEGDKIAFSLELDFGQGPQTFDYTGVVSPGQIKVHSDVGGMAVDFVLKPET